MAIILQDETGLVADANSYVDYDYFYSYFISRGVDASDYDIEVVESSLVKATDYVDSRFSDKLIGYVSNADQITKWPRKNAISKNGHDYSDVIPVILKRAVCEYAVYCLDGSELSPTPEYTENAQNLKSESVKIGPITETKTYKDDHEKNVIRSYPKADMYMKDLVSNFGTSSHSLLRA